MPRLLILTPGDLAHDPRALRAAAVATEHGIDVVSLSASSSPPEEVPSPGPGSMTTIAISTDRVTSRLRRAGLGGMRSQRALPREARGIYRLARLAWDTTRLVRAGRRAGEVDVVHANDLDTLPAGFRLARTYGATLVYDAHEIYASQEPDPPRVYQAVMSRLERQLARRARVSTVSELIASELQRTLRLEEMPLVVLNCPRRVDVPEPEGDRGAAVKAIYQGAMGPGRLISDILDAAVYVTDAVALSVRVVGLAAADLRRECVARGIAHRVTVLEPAAHDRLVEALSPFDVGLIINRPVTRNDELVFPNKLFEYMMAGLAIVAPRLPGLAPLIEREEIGLTFRPGSPVDLARALNELGEHPDRLAAMRKRARELALERYNAEAQAPALLRAWGV